MSSHQDKTRSTRNGVGIATIVWLLLPHLALGQKRIAISSTPSCGTCRVELVKLATIAATDSIPTPNARVIVRNSKGHFFMSGGVVRGVGLEYDSDGRLLRTFGRFGEGPGEFKSVAAIAVGLGDTLYVYDSALRRISVLSPEGKFVTSSRLMDMPLGLYGAPDGQIVAVNPMAKDRCFLMLARDGSTAAVGGDCLGGDPRYNDMLGPKYFRSVAGIDKSHLFAARMNRYEIEERDYQGTIVRLLTRDVDWFPPWEPDGKPYDRNAPEPRPQPVIMGLGSTADGLLVVTSVRAAKDWTPPKRDPKSGALLPGEGDKVISTFDVIDPKTADLMVSLDVPGRVGYGVYGMLVSVRREDDNGEEYLDILEIKVTRH